MVGEANTDKDAHPTAQALSRLGREVWLFVLAAVASWLSVVQQATGRAFWLGRWWLLVLMLALTLGYVRAFLAENKARRTEAAAHESREDALRDQIEEERVICQGNQQTLESKYSAELSSLRMRLDAITKPQFDLEHSVETAAQTGNPVNLGSEIRQMFHAVVIVTNKGPETRFSASLRSISGLHRLGPRPTPVITLVDAVGWRESNTRESRLKREQSDVLMVAGIINAQKMFDAGSSFNFVGAKNQLSDPSEPFNKIGPYVPAKGETEVVFELIVSSDSGAYRIADCALVFNDSGSQFLSFRMVVRSDAD